MKLRHWGTYSLAAFTLVALTACGGNKSSSGGAASTAAGVTSSSGAASGSGSTSGTNSGSAAGTTSGSTAGTTSGAATGALALAAIAPQNGPQDGGTQVTITGSGFAKAGAGDTIVLFGTVGVRATPLSDTEIQVTTPLSLQAGAVDLRVVNDLGTAILPGAFTFDQRAAALSFSPPVGHHEAGFGGTKITLKVERFTVSAQTTVRFAQTAATAISVVDSNTLLVEVPDGLSAGAVDVTVEEAGQSVVAAGFEVQGAIAYGDLTINEIMGNPSGVDANRDGVTNSSGDEYIEIVNTTNKPLDLSYLSIWDGANQERHRFPNPTTLPPGGAIVVFGSGTPIGFEKGHKSGVAQQATSGMLGLNNGSESVELRTQPGLNPTGTVLFKLEYTSALIGAALVNKNDGQKITANPAGAADYEDHSAANGANGGASPGVKVDGTSFR